MKKIYFYEKSYRKVPASFQIYNGKPRISTVDIDEIAQVVMRNTDADQIAFTGVFDFKTMKEKVLKYPMTIPREKWWPVFECDDFYYAVNCSCGSLYALPKKSHCGKKLGFWVETEVYEPMLFRV